MEFSVHTRIDERAGLGNHDTINDHLAHHDPADAGLTIVEQP
jgi:hypothetical protein